jgi:hypothetical protein
MVGTARRDRAARAGSLDELAAKIEAIERKSQPGFGCAIVTAWPKPLARLACGVLHEWLCVEDGASGASGASGGASGGGLFLGGRNWSPPLLLLAQLARLALRQRVEQHSWVVWIGRRLWPQARALIGDGSESDAGSHAEGYTGGGGHAAGGDRRLLDCTLLVDPATESDRLWSIDLCLQSPAVAVVAADAGGMTLAQTRRLQLAAEAGGSLALLVRPGRDAGTPSAAGVRWRIERVPSSAHPRWSIQLVRCKGVQRRAGMDAVTPLVLEHDHASGDLRVPADVAHRSPDAAARVLAGWAARRAG